MTEKEFIKLKIQDQLMIVFESGEEIASRLYAGFSIKLYSIFDFYIEVWYIKNENKVDRLNIIDTEKVSRLYSSAIDITDIFK